LNESRPNWNLIMECDNGIADEAMALWLALFGEPPIVVADGSEMFEAVVKTLPGKPYLLADGGAKSS
jgi:hypothetical protein